MSVHDRWQADLQQLRDRGRYRALAPPAGIDFTSNDYLGYGKLHFAGASGFSHSGQASRLLRGHDPVWDEVEALLAHWHGAEAALVFNSGYAANEGLLATLLGPDDVLFSDQCNHASIIDGARLGKARRFIFRHNDLDHLGSGLRDTQRTTGGEWFIITESLFGMEGDRAPLAELADLAGRFGAHLLVDEAHATGCFGPRGAGRVDELGLRGRVLASIHTGGKALGVLGAYVCGSTLLKEILVNRCRHLIFTTALPPVVGSWWLTALERVQRDDTGRRTLHFLARCFRDELHTLGMAPAGSDYIVPVILGDDARALQAGQRLQAAGYDVRAIRPPTVPEGGARLRVSIHADHTERAVIDLAKLLGKEH